MDDQTFDRVTRLFRAPGSRRRALRALLGAALLGGATRSEATTPRTTAAGRGRQICVADTDCLLPPQDTPENPSIGASCCADKRCSCAGQCCPNRCFWRGRRPEPIVEFCCTGPDWILCENAQGEDVCCENGGKNPCGTCLSASGLAGSYRRP
jgi:hypothetical protein